MGIFNGRNRESSVSCWIKLALVGFVIAIALRGANCDQEPTESQCRPYIEKALKEKNLDAEEKSDEEIPPASGEVSAEQEENPPTDELTDSNESSKRDSTEDLKSEEGEEDDKADDDDSGEKDEGDDKPSGEADESVEAQETESAEEEKPESGEGASAEEKDEKQTEEERESGESGEKAGSKEETEETKSGEEEGKAETESLETDSKEDENVTEEQKDEGESREEKQEESKEETAEEEDEDSKPAESGEETDSAETSKVEKSEENAPSAEEQTESPENEGDAKESKEQKDEDVRSEEAESAEDETPSEEDKDKDDDDDEDKEDETESKEGEAKESEEEQEKEKEGEEKDSKEGTDEEGDSKETVADDGQSEETKRESGEAEESKEAKESEETEKSAEPAESAESTEAEDKPASEETASQEAEKSGEEGDEESIPDEEDLTKEVVIPENLRQRDHITKILRLDEDSVETESVLAKAIDSTLKTLKNLYDNAIKPLEMLYKYRDLSNRHFGDPEIFSKPLVLFMGPWSGGKSSTINYLLDIEFSHMALRTGAEPSPAYFNILMHGKDEEILDGTQLAADWTFSGLQKFGQGLLDRLRGVKLNNRLLEKVNIVEIPGILEIRKQVQRLFPFNDACQWFIDRADIIFLVYDPAKLDVGPETEAILDQLKGREYQTRIILNKADQVKPEELMRVQGTLIWNISPLMSSTEPPIMYTTSLWSLPYEVGAPTRLLHAQERAFLRDLREAVEKRVENKIASARRFAVRVRNHAKMVDCYLTTYYNHKTFFGNRKKISDDIVENPQKYHIYEGLSTLTNISRYDLPDPDVYRDFFKINPLYDFIKLSDTCTYFRGCPINKLDVAIAYDLPELVGKYKKAVEAAKEQTQKTNS